MVRTPSYDKNGMKKGAWSAEEDAKLKDYISNHDHWNWRELPNFAGLKRCGKSCRLRWMNYLKPGLKHGNYTMEEDQLIIQLHQQHGNKWAEIALKLPGRSDNDIKNHWHTHLKKRVGLHKPAGNSTKMIHRAAPAPAPVLGDEIGRDMQIEILESCPLKYPEVEIGGSSSSSSDWGLEEMMNSADLMSTLLSPINQHEYDPNLEGLNAILAADSDSDYREVDQDSLWREVLLLSDNYDLNCYQHNDDFNLFFNQTM